MKTLATAFKEVYGEALKEYGFKKVKGKYPYYARVIGDEIVHVITFVTRPKRRDGYKEYDVYAGIATVYRHCINFDLPVLQNFNWMNSLLEFYKKNNPYMDATEWNKAFKKWYTFSYEENNEISLINSLKNSFDVTKEVILPTLDEVNSLNKCVSFWEKHDSTMLRLYDDETFGLKYCSGEYNEGLLNVLLFNVEQYTRKRYIRFTERNEYMKYLIESGNIEYVKETIEKMNNDYKETMIQQIDIFTMMRNNSDKYEAIIAELQRRKEFNLMKLKQYGIEI